MNQAEQFTIANTVLGSSYVISLYQGKHVEHGQSEGVKRILDLIFF